jgi:hypothetical protein
VRKEGREGGKEIYKRKERGGRERKREREGGR